MHGAITGTAFERADVEAAVEAARAARDEAIRAFIDERSTAVDERDAA